MEELSSLVVVQSSITRNSEKNPKKDDFELLSQSPQRIFDQQQNLMPHEVEALKKYGEEFLKKGQPKKIIFISYAWSMKPAEDKWDEQWTDQFVWTLAEHIRLMGFECILDRTHLGWGRSLDDAMNESVNKAAHIVLIVTNTYVYKYKNRQKSGVRVEMEYIEKRIDKELGGVDKAGSNQSRFILPMVFVEPGEIRDIKVVEGLSGFAGIYFDKRDYFDVLMEFPNKLYGIREAPINKKFVYAGLEELLRAIRIDFKRQIGKDVRLHEDLACYCYPDVVFSPNGNNREPLRDVTDRFLSDARNKNSVLLLQGESGLGKSTFLYRYAEDLWSASASKIQEEAFYIPLIIELRSYRKKKSLAKYLKKRYGFKKEEINRLRQRCKFLLLVDGYDEYVGKKGESTRPILKNLIEDIESWDVMVIVTCRSFYLTQVPNHKSLFSIAKNHNSMAVDECWLAPFTDKQIDTVVKKYFELVLPNSSVEECQRVLTQTPHLWELCQSPLQLRMILAILPNVTPKELGEINRAGIYRKFISQWFEREGQRLVDRLGELPEEDTCFEEYFGFFAKELAFAMFVERPDSSLLTVEYRPRVKKRKPGGSSEAEDVESQKKWERFFGGNTSVVYKRGGCPLRCVEFKYSFYHKSFFEYLVARYLFENLGLDQGDDSVFLEEFGKLSETDFNRKLITSEPEILPFFVEMLYEKPRNVERLREIVRASKKNPAVAIAASNAFSILVAARVSLDQADLEKTYLQNSDATGAMLHRASLVGANLRGVNLSLSNLDGANCRQAFLKDVELGEQYVLRVADWGGAAIWFNAQGRLMAAEPSCELQGIKIVEYATNTQVGFLPCGEDEDFSGCSVTADGSYLAWGFTEDKASLTQLWRLSDNTMLGIIEESVLAIAVSPNKRLLAFKSLYDEVSIIDFQKPKEIFEIRPRDEGLSNILCADDSLAFSSDGFYFAASQIHRGEIFVWETCSFEEEKIVLPAIGYSKNRDLIVIKGKLPLNEGEENEREEPIQVWGVAFNPVNNQLVAGYGHGQIVFWEIPSGNMVRRFSSGEQPIYSVKFSHTGDFFVSGGDDCKVRLWDSTTGNFLGLLLEFSCWIFQLRLGPDSRMLAVEGEGNVTQVPVENRLRIMDKGHTLPVKSICFSPDGSLVVTLGEDCYLCVWSVSLRQMVAKVECAEPVDKIQFSKDGKKLYGIPGLFVSSINRLVVWETRSWKKIDEIKIIEEKERAAVDNFLFDARTNMLVFEEEHRAKGSKKGKDGIRIIKLESSQAPFFLEHPSEYSKQSVDALALSPDGCLLVVAYYKLNFICFFTIPNKKQRNISIDLEQDKQNGVASFIFSPSGQLLVAATKSGNLHLIKTSRKAQEKKPFIVIKLADHKHLDAVCFSKDEKVMFIATAGCISAWSIEGHCYAYVSANVGAVTGMDVNLSLRKLATAGGNNSVVLWEITSEYDFKPNFTSRPMFSSKGAVFSEDCGLTSAQRMLVRQRGGIFQAGVDINSILRDLLPFEEAFYFKPGRQLFKSLCGAVDSRIEKVRTFVSSRMHISYECPAEKSLVYNWDEEVIEPCLMSLNQLFGLVFRAFQQKDDENRVDALIRINIWGVMETMSKKLQELKIPHRVFVDKKYRGCLVIPDIFALFNQAVLEGTEQYNPRSRLENWRKIRVVNKKWSKKHVSHHCRFFVFARGEEAQQNGFLSNMRQVGFDVEVKADENENTGILVDLTMSRIRK